MRLLLVAMAKTPKIITPKDNYKGVKTRINTNGHANFVYKRDVTRELVGLIDEISVSLNASTEDMYKRLSQPTLKTDKPLEIVKDFIKCSVASGIKTDTSVVNGYKDYKLDLKECEKISKDLGAHFRVREWLDNGY